MTELIEQLRNKVGVEKCKHLTDADIKRFLTARNNVLPKSVIMLEEYLKWYHTPIKGMLHSTPATILDTPESEEQIKIWRDHFPFAFTGHDKEGNPLYWEKAGFTIANFSEGKKHCSEDKLVWHHILKQEFVTRETMKHASEFYKKDIYQIVCVCDMKNIKLGLDTSSLSYFIRATTIDQYYYPERLKKFFIINAPWFFKTIWAMVHPFLDAKTISKFEFLGSDYINKLKEYIDVSQIPNYLGGELKDFEFVSRVTHIDSDEFCAKAINNTKKN